MITAREHLTQVSIQDYHQCKSACFCTPCLQAQGSIRKKPSANYKLYSSINREQTDSKVQMILGHYHRLSSSSKPKVTTALTLCTEVSKGCLCREANRIFVVSLCMFMMYSPPEVITFSFGRCR